MQNDAGKGDHSTKVDCVRIDDLPAKKPRPDADVRSTEMSGSVDASVGENSSLFIALTAFDDSQQLPRSPLLDVPRSPLLDGRSSNSDDLPASSSDGRELCRTDDSCACSKPQQLCSTSPSASPKLPANVDHNSHRQSVNGICDISSLKLQYRNAVTTVDASGCNDGVADDLVDDCRIGASQTNGLASPEPQVAAVVVNGGSIVHDCSCST